MEISQAMRKLCALEDYDKSSVELLLAIHFERVGAARATGERLAFTFSEQDEHVAPNRLTSLFVSFYFDVSGEDAKV